MLLPLDHDLRFLGSNLPCVVVSFSGVDNVPACVAHHLDDPSQLIADAGDRHCLTG